MQENLHTIEQSVMRMDRIVLDLMDTVSIEQGRLALSLVPSDLGVLLHSVEKDFSSHPSSGNNQLVPNTTRPPGNLCRPGTADPGYHQSDLQCRSSHSKRNHHHFPYRRTGLADHLRFRHRNRHVEESEERTQGLCFCSKDYWRRGIGVYVCHQIITAHGGKIWLKSQEGEGTQVFFSLPEEVS